mmetsp:Transcript_133951/g.346939  ORF Transcript_133951/g.346939 Transcript_133951/m.346939 type:complete len:273 (+) Transcript_133951:2342-3160(+)
MLAMRPQSSNFLVMPQHLRPGSLRLALGRVVPRTGLGHQQSAAEAHLQLGDLLRIPMATVANTRRRGPPTALRPRRRGPTRQPGLRPIRPSSREPPRTAAATAAAAGVVAAEASWAAPPRLPCRERHPSRGSTNICGNRGMMRHRGNHSFCAHTCTARHNGLDGPACRRRSARPRRHQRRPPPRRRRGPSLRPGARSTSGNWGTARRPCSRLCASRSGKRPRTRGDVPRSPPRAKMGRPRRWRLTAARLQRWPRASRPRLLAAGLTMAAPPA